MVTINPITYHPIGIIRSPHQDPKGTPIQPTAGQGIKGVVEIQPQYVSGLQDLDGFSYLILLYSFDRVQETKLVVKPFLDEASHGIFSTRAPVRPNPIGLSIVKLVGIEGNRLYIEDVDILDGTPLLDVKPYVDRFDVRQSERQGWLETNLGRLAGKTDDGRFCG
ncbi:MAG: tRNA (N6-threonylcarbamoyladenosine(37)-N6)-methyltransferase TrmO [Anaerolineales bacterium]|nr:tRNA (N6-threonylcarbamoyladenosine(37)-N6)-methyltransferase TrmO [Anaerolineales bacterium]